MQISVMTEFRGEKYFVKELKQNTHLSDSDYTEYKANLFSVDQIGQTKRQLESFPGWQRVFFCSRGEAAVDELRRVPSNKLV